jgi:hypothetical protein
MNIRKFIIWFSIAGASLFAFAFTLSFISPPLLESVAKTIIRHELERRVTAKLEAIGDGKVGKALDRIAPNHADEIAKMKKEIEAMVPSVIAQMSDPACECRKRIESYIAHFDFKSLRIGNITERAKVLIQAKYMEVVQALTQEFRIFTFANAIVFALLGLVAYFFRNAGMQLILPTIVLIGAAVLVGFFYIFGQDWIHTIIFSEYVGYGYFSYLGLAVAFMADIVFNRGRVLITINEALQLSVLFLF